MSQNNLIIQWLSKPGRTITPLQALKKFNCWSLSSRISEIKKSHPEIRSKLVNDKKTGKVYAKYYFV